ncbi:MAG: hypothetical protein A2351_02195 [Omnitrophica bacterium RIFOXYB12_FULL_50_7]|nr:MAG: hypothetical protein A2351_02195 [Omnitrophica bacterium RIFOXYB12_FULL_50_7]
MLLKLTDILVYGILRLDPEKGLSKVIHFFVYDSVKILLLLFTLILVIGVLRTFIPQSRIHQWMGRKRGLEHFFAALFGAVTPFCSCSSIPIFFGFLDAGVPLGVSFSFLITSPLINEYLVVLMLGFFGWKITALYVVSGLLIGTFSGIILGRMQLERHLVPDFINEGERADEKVFRSFRERFRFGWTESCSITGKIWGWVLIGVGIGAAIHNYVPQEAIQAIIGKMGALSVPVATILGMPMYGSCAGIVPIAVVLFQKGIPLGTALAFMMGVAALSLPEAIMLRRAMKLQLIAVFFGVTTLAIIVTGYIFNFLQRVLV